MIDYQKYYLVQGAVNGPVISVWEADEKAAQEYWSENHFVWNQIGTQAAHRIWSGYTNTDLNEFSKFDAAMVKIADDFSDFIEELHAAYWEEFSKSEYNDEADLLIEAAGRDTLEREAFLQEQQQERYKAVA